MHMDYFLFCFILIKINIKRNKFGGAFGGF